MIVREEMISEAAIRHIINNLRPRDRAEIFALRWNDDAERLIAELMMTAGAMWRVWTVDDVPAAVAGMTPMRPGVVAAGAFGTAMWPHCVRHMLRWGRTWCYPRLRASGYHRGECYALKSNEDGRKFIEACGGEIEALLHGYGRNKEDFLLYSWRIDDVFQLQSAAAKAAALLENRPQDRTKHSRHGRSRITTSCH